MSSLPKPQYTIWQALTAALALAERAISEVRALAREPGPKGDPGSPGPIGMGFEDMVEEMAEDGRTLIRRYSRGSEIREFRFKLGIPLDKGVWKPGNYDKGDLVTFDGSLFSAQKDTNGKPQDSRDWRLAVKRGRDGKDVVDKPPPPRSTIPFGDK